MLDKESLCALFRVCKSSKAYKLDRLSWWYKYPVSCKISGLDEYEANYYDQNQILMLNAQASSELPIDSYMFDSLRFISVIQSLAVLSIDINIHPLSPASDLPILRNLKWAKASLIACSENQLDSILHMLSEVTIFHLEVQDNDFDLLGRSYMMNKIMCSLKNIKDLELTSCPSTRAPLNDIETSTNLQRLSMNHKDINDVLLGEPQSRRSELENRDMCFTPQLLSSIVNCFKNLAILELCMCDSHHQDNIHKENYYEPISSLKSLKLRGNMLCNTDLVYKISPRSLIALDILHIEPDLRSSRKILPFSPSLMTIAENFPDLELLCIYGKNITTVDAREKLNVLRSLAKKVPKLTILGIEDIIDIGKCETDEKEEFCTVLENFENLKSISSITRLPYRHFPPQIKYFIIRCENWFAGFDNYVLIRFGNAFKSVPDDSCQWHEAQGSAYFQLDSSKWLLEKMRRSSNFII